MEQQPKVYNDLSKLDGVTRRDFLRVTKQFGVSSTLLGLAGLTGAVSLPRLAEAANSTYEKRFKNEPKVKIKFGADGMNARIQKIQFSGSLHWTQDIEERTEGAIRVEFIGSNQLCGQLDCVKKTMQGIVDMYTSSTQNAASGAPYWNVLDYAYMFPSRAAIHYFLYHPDNVKLLRDPMQKRHKLNVLWSHAELRNIMLGKGWQDKPTVTSVTQLAGTKNRVTGTQLGRIAMTLMKLNPVPIAWEETLDGLKQGLIDGAETWSSASCFANMAPVMSQDVGLEFFAGTHATAMRTQTFDKMSPVLQDAVMESAYQTQIWSQGHHEAGLVNVCGASVPQHPDTIYGRAGVRFAKFSPEALKECEEMCSPKHHPKEWEKWRDRLNKWSGGHDTYKEISAIAAKYPAGSEAIHVEPRRWWRG